MSASIDNIFAIFNTWGNVHYNESLTQLAHAEQSAALARDSGAEDHLVIAALLHDVGHLLVLQQTDGHAQLDSDDEHEAVGARFVAQLFGAKVAGPIALHVAAKRYLCAVEKNYVTTLSPASITSLGLQGGPMSQEEVSRFQRMPYFSAAVALRRWDDEAKVQGLDVTPFATFVPIMERLTTSI